MDTIKSPAEQRVILRNISWDTYERLLGERRENRAPRFTYDRGMLEIMSPSPEHESISYYAGLIVAVVAAEMDVDVCGVGSTTFKRENLDRGFEPDACFYARNLERVRGKKRLELGVDPPPDLVIEVDITSPSIDKLSIYARLAVPEVWRYIGEGFEILSLEGEAYRQAEQRVILRNVSWETYGRLLNDHLDSSAPRFTFDRGMLEIMSPSPEHEKFNRRIAQLVLAFAEEMGVESEDLGSTTFRREDLERGFEPDSCFYIENEESIRGKSRIDLTVDPPPDLVIEIDLTSLSMNKLPIYARIGVPEVWRYDGRRFVILKLEGDGYVEANESIVLPPATAAALSDLVEKGKTTQRTDWLRAVREWVRERAGQTD